LRRRTQDEKNHCSHPWYLDHKKVKTNERESHTHAELSAEVARHPFFLGLKPEHLRLLTDCAMATQFDRDQIIFRAGETANRFYLIEEGHVVLEAGEEEQPVIIDRIGAGDLLGWSWIFPPYRWHFAARATEPTRAIFFYGTILREYCEKDPALGYELFKRMSEIMMKRLQRARGELIAALVPTKKS
jgi:CRP/FNR family transcriptional regulator, cyclic AMP receptor protein